MEKKNLKYMLPESKRYNARANMFHDFGVIDFVKDHLSKADWDFMCRGCFGYIIRFKEKVPLHYQLIHYALMHELETKYKHEMWFRIGEQVCRFSLMDFAAITGLKCDNVPQVDVPADDDVHLYLHAGHQLAGREGNHRLRQRSGRGHDHRPAHEPDHLCHPDPVVPGHGDLPADVLLPGDGFRQTDS